MPYETRSKTVKKPDAAPVLEVRPEPVKARSKKTDGEPKTTKKGSKAKGTSKTSKSSDSSSSQPGTLRGRPKDLPVLTEDEEDEVVVLKEQNPMEKHRNHYGTFLKLCEAFMEGIEDKDLHATYDKIARRTRNQVKMLQQLKERHKDDPQAVLAKTPMGKKMMGASGRRQGWESDDDMFDDNTSEASSVATGASSMKTPTSRKLRPRGARKSVVVALLKSPWRKSKAGRGRKKKAVKKAKKTTAASSDAGDEYPQSTKSSGQENIVIPAEEQGQGDAKRAPKRPVEDTEPQKSIFVPNTDFDYAQHVNEPATKKRILAPTDYKYASGDKNREGHMDRARDAGYERKQTGGKDSKAASSQSTSSTNREQAVVKKPKAAVATLQNKEVKDAQRSSAPKTSVDKAAGAASKAREIESKDVPPKKIKKLAKTEKVNAVEIKSGERPLSHHERSVPKQARAYSATPPLESDEEPDLFTTPTSRASNGPTSNLVESSTKNLKTSQNNSEIVEPKIRKSHEKFSTDSTSRPMRSGSPSQKAGQNYNATYVLSEDEVFPSPPVQKPHIGSQVLAASSGLGNATFVVPQQKQVRKPSCDSPVVQDNNATFVVPPTTGAKQVHPQTVEVETSEQPSAKHVIKKESDCCSENGSSKLRKEMIGNATGVKNAVQREASQDKLGLKPQVAAVKPVLPTNSSSKDKVLPSKIRNGLCGSSCSSGSVDSQVSSSQGSSVASVKSNPAIKLATTRASPVMWKTGEPSGMHAKPPTDPAVEMKKIEEKQRKAEENKKQALLQKKKAQEKQNEQWKQKLEEMERKREFEKKKEEAKLMAHMEKNKTGKAEESKGGYVKNILSLFKTPGNPPAAKLPTTSKHLQTGGFTSSCPDVSKKPGLMHAVNTMKMKDVHGSVDQLNTNKNVKASPKKVVGKPMLGAAAAAVPSYKCPPAPTNDADFLEKSCVGDESFMTADTTIDEGEKISTYDITVYEDLNDDMRHRENKRIPAWAADSDQLNLALFMQQPDLISLMKKPIFPPKNIGFKIFPNNVPS